MARLRKSNPRWFSGGRPARIVTVAPESAGQIEPALPSIAQGRPHLKSLAIDYREFLFAKKPEPASKMTAAMVAPASQPVQHLMPTRVLVAAATDEQHSKTRRRWHNR